jgi:hypothetical protein
MINIERLKNVKSIHLLNNFVMVTQVTITIATKPLTYIEELT